MKKIVLRTLFSVLFLGSLCLTAKADTVLYQVTINTFSQSGNYGYIDISLNQGTLGAQPVTASITGFIGGTLNPADTANDAIGTSGNLPGTLTIPAASSTDYFEGLTFGDSISFDVALSGTGVNLAGLAGGSSGTTFALGFYDISINPLFTNDQSKAAGLINIANNGTVGVDALPDPLGGPSLATFAPLDTPPAVTPEPSSLSFFACAGAVSLLLRRFANMVTR